ncbi:MAG: efflux RND transporter periplasmic adaptor subunit [Dethiobacter sp.]|nr:efflux RND transporter periplasmic adaptor subunit [Dethiobacter sp.]MCL5982877.1 efflux RND transporter periplasmic adaptor subunit [Bacillota bacterium]
MRRRVVVLVIMGLLALLITGCGRGGAEPVAVPEAVPVRVEQAAVGAIRETVSFSGEVAAGSEAQVTPKVAGLVVRVAVTVGQEVRKGDLLVELEAQAQAVAVRQAEAAAEMARANLQNAKVGGALAQLQAAVRQTQASYNNAESILGRMEMLYREGAIALQQLEGARLQAQVAESQYSLAREQLAIFERGEGQVQVLAAQVRQAEAGLELARLNLNHARIVAPVAGLVVAVNAQAGNMASPGVPVVTLVGLDGVTVTARLTEQAVGLFSPGMAVEVEVPAVGVTLDGEVQEVAPSAAAGARSFLVKARMASAEGLRPGMFARLRLAVDERAEAVLLPRAAVLQQEGRYFAFTIKDGKAVRREVTVGLQDESFAEIVTGFAAGETVITAGQQFLNDGATVLVEVGGDS